MRHTGTGAAGVGVVWFGVMASLRNRIRGFLPSTLILWPVKVTRARDMWTYGAA
jgi:hypothetical protein